jgi:phosphate transport system permease protein
MTQENGSISRPPTSAELLIDRTFRGLTRGFAWLTIALVALLFVQMTITAWPAIREHGTGFLTGTEWSASKNQFGILPQIGGTLYSSVLGVALGALFGVSVAIFLTQDYLPPKLEAVLKNTIELLAAIPSVVYGLWGIFVVIPFIKPAADWLHTHVGWFPLFSTRLVNPGMLPAALVLAIMVLPTITAISRDALAAVPPKLREASYGLGATRWETILAVILPTASRGVYGSIVLAFGRAVGETMALALLLGNTNQFSWSLFAPGNTLASLMANQWPESGPTEKSALLYAGLVLLAITMTINAVGALIVRRTSVRAGAVK